MAGSSFGNPSGGWSGYSGFSGASSSNPSGVDITVTAGETLSARDCVYIARQYEAGKTAGRAYKTTSSQTSQSTLAFWIGFATTGITAGSTGKVRIAGVINGFTGLSDGAPQYVSTVAGLIVEDKPVTQLLVGMAISSTEVLINSRGVNTDIANTGRPGTKAYLLGGSQGSYLNNADKLVYSTETCGSATNAVLSLGRYGPAGVSEGVTKGYAFGGVSAGGDSNVTLADKVTFSNDTTAAATTANLASERKSQAAGLSSTTKGYVLGGNTFAGYTVTADKITFSSDTTATATSANLSVTTGYAAGCSEGTSKGYVNGLSNTTNRVTYSNDTSAAVTAANLLGGRLQAGAVSNGSTYGYYTGGLTGTITSTNRITFSNDTASTVTTANLSHISSGLVGTSMGPVKGYFSGGKTGDYGYQTTIDRITFSSETTATLTTATISYARETMAGVPDITF